MTDNSQQYCAHYCHNNNSSTDLCKRNEKAYIGDPSQKQQPNCYNSGTNHNLSARGIKTFGNDSTYNNSNYSNGNYPYHLDTLP